MPEKKTKSSKQLEKHFKGVANHWRLEILLLLSKETDKSLQEIADAVLGNMKTISEHTRRLFIAGLINKKYKGRTVLHSLSPYGQRFIKFINSFQHS